MTIKKTIKQTQQLGGGLLGLSALSIGAQSLNSGLNTSGFYQGVGSALPPVGSILGTKLVIDSAKMLGNVGQKAIRKHRRK